MSINEAAFTMAQESTYSIQEAKQLLQNMCFSDRKSESEWLDQHIKEVTTDEVNLYNVILYRVKVNNLEVEAL